MLFFLLLKFYLLFFKSLPELFIFWLLLDDIGLLLAVVCNLIDGLLIFDEGLGETVGALSHRLLELVGLKQVTLLAYFSQVCRVLLNQN